MHPEMPPSTTAKFFLSAHLGPIGPRCYLNRNKVCFGFGETFLKNLNINGICHSKLHSLNSTIYPTSNTPYRVCS